LVSKKENLMPFETKTLEQWNRARVDLTHFLTVGDFVDEAIYENLRDALPPMTHRSRFFQLGEPYSFVDSGETYTTLIKINGRWMYSGHCHQGKPCEPGLGLLKRMSCSCCGAWCTGRQWHNRDQGFGLCGDCVKWLRSPKHSDGQTPRESEEEIRRCYGIEGIHFNVFEV
jgi:hypothetical protein